MLFRSKRFLDSARKDFSTPPEMTCHAQYHFLSFRAESRNRLRQSDFSPGKDFAKLSVSIIYQLQ